MNLPGNATPCNVDSLPQEICTLEDIPQTGERIIKKGDIMDIFSMMKQAIHIQDMMA